MKKLKNLLLYGSLDKETYDNIRSRINEENRRSVDIFTLMGSACFLIPLVLTLQKNEDVPIFVYLIGIGALLLMHMINRIGSEKAPIVSDCFAIIYTILLLMAGVLLAYSQCDERTTLLLPFFILVSLVFCYRPIYLAVILIGTEICYLLVMHGVQHDNLYFINSVNTCIFCFIGIFAGFYTLRMKHKKYKAEYENQILLERDILTGVYNRYSCKNALKNIVEMKKPVTICSLDVNGLKGVNDTKGHLAGDELIQGAALCIIDIFGTYGDIYRIGGDEFCVLIYKPFDEESMRQAFYEKTEAWRGNFNAELSIALGMSVLDSDYEERLEDVIHEADLQMFEEKRKYYNNSNELNG